MMESTTISSSTAQPYTVATEDSASSLPTTTAGPTITTNGGSFSANSSSRPQGSTIPPSHVPALPSGPIHSAYEDENNLVPFATKDDADSYQAVATRIQDHPEPNVREVANQLIRSKLGVDGDSIVIAHFKDDTARAQGKPDSTKTLTDVVMDGLRDFQGHGAVPATLGVIGGVFMGGDSSSPATFVNDLIHSDSFGDGLKKIGNFLWSRTLPGWIQNTFFSDGNVIDKAKEEYQDIDTSYGLFKNNGKGYSKENSYELKPSEVYDKFRATTTFGELPYIKTLNGKIDSYWNDMKNDWPIAARYNFVEQARAARDNGELTPEQYRLVMKGGAPGVPLKGPVTFEQISKPAPPDPSVSVERFDINGYPSTNILRFKGADVDGEVMYVPGNKPPFVPLSNKEESLQWTTSQAKPPRREALLGHFSIFNRQDGSFHYGVEAGLDGLANGSWAPSYLNYYDGQDRNKIRTDVFEDMRTQTDNRLREDAYMQTRTAWDGWSRTIDRDSLVFGPVLAGGVQLGLGVDRAVNGRTYKERQDGVVQAVDGGIYTGMDIVFGAPAPGSRGGHYSVHEASKSHVTGGDAQGAVASNAQSSIAPIRYRSHKD